MVASILAQEDDLYDEFEDEEDDDFDDYADSNDTRVNGDGVPEDAGRHGWTPNWSSGER